MTRKEAKDAKGRIGMTEQELRDLIAGGLEPAFELLGDYVGEETDVGSARR